ncbi:MAG TPA: prolyl oligopeptidase family serine peptidase [Candidatus Doudnabacteria bacterium]|nr:prolyl oligopeptidase family serine peptidase [Candidatus Doudnabacteria bacterium]
MYTLRTRFAKDIVCEFLPPTRKTKKQRVIIFADGMPSVPSKKHLLEFFSKKGFWVFHPRYRGTWESDGKFLAKSPHKDIKNVIGGLHSNFVSLWDYNLGDKKIYKLSPAQIILIGSSFGGPAALLNSVDPRVDKIIAISPVIDWTKPGKAEPLDLLAKFTEQAFGNGYRVSSKGWQKIKLGKFYNPVAQSEEIDGSKALLIHAKDDDVCRYSETKKFASQTGAKLITLPKGGHLGASLLLTPRFAKIFTKFINSK